MLDLLMPGVDGWQVFEHVREMNGHQPRIAFLTGVDSSEVAVAAMKLGAQDWILKPFEEAALLIRVRALCSEIRRVRVQGGDLGSRATIATLSFARCGAFVLYEADGSTSSSGGSVEFVEADRAVTLEGLRRALSSPPLSLAGLHLVTTKALHHVSRQYREVNVAGLADTVGVHVNYLLERFRGDVGLTPREYIARVRVEVMKQRLRQAGCPSLDRLAEDVGLCDGAHVHKVFARYERRSPSVYRANGPAFPGGSVERYKQERGSVH